MVFEQTELKYKGKVVFERLVMSGQFGRVPKMFLENEACFLYLTKGAFSYRTPSNLLAFAEGDAMLTKCGNHFVEGISVKDTRHDQIISVVGVFFFPSIIKGFFETDLSLEGFESNFDTVKIDIDPLLKSFMDSLNYMLDNPRLADDNFTANKLKELLILLSKSDRSKSINEFVHSLFVPHEYKFKEIIRQNIYSKLSLKELAYLCGMSLATFKRKFSESYGQSPGKYLLNKRLERAEHLVRNQSISISEIAHECGFQTTPALNRAFKKKVGKSLTQLRMS